MQREEILISDNESNHLLVALDFYDDEYKLQTFNIPPEFSNIEIADISIEKDDLNKPIGLKAFMDMTRWLYKKYIDNNNVIFTFICSIDSLATNHHDLSPQTYRWRLFDMLFKRAIDNNYIPPIKTQDITIGPDGFQSFGRAFYRDAHAPIIHLISTHLSDKY